MSTDDTTLPWLTPSSIVIEMGAYRGNWVYEVSTRYHCTVHAFEPASLALKFLRERVGGLDNVIIHPVALSTEDEEATLHNCERDGASIYATIGHSETIQCVDAAKVIEEIGQVDLMHMNAEGAELDVLDHLINTEQIVNIERIMVQWHPLDRKRALTIGYTVKRLLDTHTRQRGYRAWNLYRRRV